MKADIDDTPIIDSRAVQRLQQLLQDKYMDVQNTALGNIGSHLDRIDQALANYDFDVAQRNAHNIVSSAGLFGMMQTVQAARELEYCVMSEHNIMAWLQLSYALRQAFDKAVNCLLLLVKRVYA